jgi:hypothetical protein
VFLLVLRHIEADHIVLIVEEIPPRRPSSVLPTPVGPRDNEPIGRLGS